MNERIIYSVGFVALLVLVWFFYSRGNLGRGIHDPGQSARAGNVEFNFFPSQTRPARVVEIDRYIRDQQDADDYYQQFKCGCG